MAGENEASVKLTAEAETKAILEYAAALREATSAAREFEAAQGASNAAGGVALGGTGSARTGGAPPPPVPTASGPAAHGTGGAPPPHPHSVPGWARNPDFNPYANPPPPITMPKPSLPTLPSDADIGADQGTGAPPPAPTGGASSGDEARGGRKPKSRLERAKDRGVGFIQQATATATGVAIGTSLTGMPLAAIQRYMALSTAIKGVSRTFREAEENAAGFGGALGLTIAQSSEAALALGRSQNTFERGEYMRNLGFARYTGLDPSQTMGQLGSIRELQGREVTKRDLMELLQGAKSLNMDQGRLQEYVQMITSTVQQQIGITGKADIQGAMALQTLPGLVYGEDDPRSRDASSRESLLGGLQNVLTSKGPMQSYMMRVMGYGRDSNLSYIDMRKRLESGIHDRQNLLDLFGSFQERGMGRGAQFRAIESVAGGSLKAHQIEALINSLGNAEGLEKYRQASKGGGSGEWEFLAGLSDEDYKAFTSGGWQGAGKKGVSAGESYQVRIEKMMMEVGQPLARAVPGLQGTMENLINIARQLAGGDVGGKLERAANALEKLTDRIDQGAVPTLISNVQDVGSRMSKTIARTNVDGVQAGAAEAIGQSLDYLGGNLKGTFEEVANEVQGNTQAGTERAGGGP